MLEWVPIDFPSTHTIRIAGPAIPAISATARAGKKSTGMMEASDDMLSWIPRCKPVPSAITRTGHLPTRVACVLCGDGGRHVSPNANPPRRSTTTGNDEGHTTNEDQKKSIWLHLSLSFHPTPGFICRRTIYKTIIQICWAYAGEIRRRDNRESYLAHPSLNYRTNNQKNREN